MMDEKIIDQMKEWYTILGSMDREVYLMVHTENPPNYVTINNNLYVFMRRPDAELALEELRREFPLEGASVIGVPANEPMAYCTVREPRGLLIQEGLPFMILED